VKVVHFSPFAASLDPIVDKDGAEARLAVVKATFDMTPDGSLRVADKQQPVRLNDEYVGEQGRSSVRYESDGAFYKPGTDVVVVGSVFSPGGRPAPRVNASIEIGPARREVAVLGDRTWECGVLGVSMTAPKPFTEMPICWERSFGGVDPFSSSSGSQTSEARNPIGTGFRTTKSSDALDGLALPNFEDPGHLISSWDQKPPPAGLGYVGRSWMSRITHAGTFDEDWRRNRMPILPKDFDYRFFMGAAPGLALPSFLRGGESVRLINLTRLGQETFRIPAVNVWCQGVAKRRRFEEPANLDTIEIDTNDRRIVLTWRYKFAVLVNEAADVVNARIERADSRRQW
jgi:hypothetical protein